LNLLQKNTSIVKQKAAVLGFSYCGIAKAGFLDEMQRDWNPG
jgi:hypothetical protein